jgi:tetratricopeptide (TPR) repeat protein
MLLGPPESAVEDFEEAGRTALAELGYGYWCIGDHDSAIAALKRVRKYGRSSAQSEYDLGHLYFQQARAQEALDAFEQALRLAPDSRAIHLALVRLLLRMDRYDRLNEILDDADRRFGPEANFLEGRALGIVFRYRFLDLLAANMEDIRAHRPRVSSLLREAIKLDPTNVRRLYRAAMCLLRCRNYIGAKEAAQLGLQLMPHSDSFRIILAQVAEYGSDDKDTGLKESVQYYEEANSLPRDELELEDDFPLLESDARTPRPVLRQFITIPLTVAGAATIRHDPLGWLYRKPRSDAPPA